MRAGRFALTGFEARDPGKTKGAPRRELMENHRVRSLVARYRELVESKRELRASFLAREIDYAKASTLVYSRVLKEVSGMKNDISCVDNMHVGGLSRAISGSRIIAGRLAGIDSN